MKELILEQLKSLIKDEEHLIPNLANASALLFQELPDISWAGFYLMTDEYLLLGPFQGKPACIRIQHGKGVCGSAAAEDKTLRIDNVHEFPGHIACDSASNSEIVIPIHHNGKVAGVLDIDSTSFSRFGEEEQILLEKFVTLLEKYWS